MTGSCPFDRVFPWCFQTAQDVLKQDSSQEAKRIKRGRPASRLGTVIKCRRDEEVLKALEGGLKSPNAPYRQIQQISIILKHSETTNSILMSVCCHRSETSGTLASDLNKKSVLLDAGAPAEWVMVGEVLQLEKEKEAEV